MSTRTILSILQLSMYVHQWCTKLSTKFRVLDTNSEVFRKRKVTLIS